jgi:hypothetical protein
MPIIKTPTIGNTITKINPVESEFGVLCEELGYCTLIQKKY